jgi:hypothetical protein
MENATGNEDEYQMLLDSQVEGRGGIDDNWHQAGQATAESYARRGLGGSGMSSGDQYEVAMKRNDAVGDAVLRARTAAIAQQRADLGQEQQALVGAQTSDINAQRLAMEEQAYRDQILAEAVGALAQTGVQYGTEAQRKKDEAEAAAKKAGG